MALQAALGTTDPSGHLFHLARDLGAEMSLTALGLPAEGVDAVVE